MERDAEGILVRGWRRRVGEVLLGSHVDGGSHHYARAREAALRARAVLAFVGLDGVVGWGARGGGEAEVDELDATVAADQHVVGLEVAMDDALLVGGDEACGGAEECLDDLTP